MTELGLAVAVLVASLTLTYVICLRPMRRGHCAMGAGRSQGRSFGETPDRDAEIAQLRQQVAGLRAESPGGRSRDSAR